MFQFRLALFTWELPFRLRNPHACAISAPQGQKLGGGAFLPLLLEQEGRFRPQLSLHRGHSRVCCPSPRLLQCASGNAGILVLFLIPSPCVLVSSPFLISFRCLLFRNSQKTEYRTTVTAHKCALKAQLYLQKHLHQKEEVSKGKNNDLLH